MFETLSAAMLAPLFPMPEPRGDFRAASVALVFRPSVSGPELLMMKRAVREGDPWSGHMAFPGGHREPQDQDDVHTAMRESAEEVGLALERDWCLGQLRPVISPRVRAVPVQRLVRAFVFTLPAAPTLRLNREASSTHWFGLQRLLAGEGRGHFPLEWEGLTYQMPRIDMDGERIWGMSLNMLDDLLERIQSLVEAS